MSTSVSITAADINKLRQATGAGMMDCRKALTETNGDFEAAIDWLRKQGQKVAAKRSDREAKEGVIIAKTTSDNTTGFIVCISCETDFVSKNADFVAFAQSIADAAVANNVKTVEELNEVTVNGAKVADLINDLAMQIAAMNPVAVDANSVPTEVVERERAIVTEQIAADPKMAGKPAEMIAKIADGKLNAFFKEQTLLAQAFVKDGSKSVGDYLKSVDADLKVLSFKRVALG
jgi:elongation factor Ts